MRLCVHICVSLYVYVYICVSLYVYVLYDLCNCTVCVNRKVFIALATTVGLGAGLRSDFDSYYGVFPGVSVEFRYCYFLSAVSAGISFFLAICSCVAACCMPH